MSSERERVRKAFAKNLTKIMGNYGVSAIELEKKTGLKKQHVYYLMKGERSPTLLTILKLRYGIGCSWDELLGK